MKAYRRKPAAPFALDASARHMRQRNRRFQYAQGAPSEGHAAIRYVWALRTYMRALRREVCRVAH